MATTLRGTYATNAGMHGVWDPHAFASVNDYDNWETELLNDADIERHIRAGHFVPIHIHADGVVEIEVRAGSQEQPVNLSEREHSYQVVVCVRKGTFGTGRMNH